MREALQDDRERAVWAAAFAAIYALELDARDQDRLPPDSEPDGFSCAERADGAVEALREALAGPNAEYLMRWRE